MPSEERVAWEYVRWLIGIFLLTFALFMSARMGIYQEMVYRKHGKHPSEALFYNVSIFSPGKADIKCKLCHHHSDLYVIADASVCVSANMNMSVCMRI